MITIIHGDDISQSRNYFQDLKRKQKNFTLFDGGTITITDLVQNIEGSGLFGSINTIFMEDFLTKLKKTEKASREILDFVARNSKKSSFILWESKEILKRDLFLFKDAIIKTFKLPKNIFLFLDGLKPSNSKNLLALLRQTLDSGIKIELILFMVQRQIRLLLAMSDSNNNESIDELARLAPWQMGKIARQAKLFDTNSLKNIYRKLYEIEIAQKTGNLSLSLTQTIDFLLLDM